MAQCERLKTCPFFSDRMENMPNVGEVLKRTYCLGDKTLCARYQVGLAGVAVPPDLFPQDAGRVREILRDR
ncbi:MAG: hypothetical protein WAM79_05980 [Candidatus Sulfotelmatobacter sp.]